jgi:hypothetical protein
MHEYVSRYLEQITYVSLYSKGAGLWTLQSGEGRVHVPSAATMISLRTSVPSSSLMKGVSKFTAMTFLPNSIIAPASKAASCKIR